jgi:3-hydroxybutyrate dehydrogenase
MSALTGRSALVTGSVRGLGLAIARALASEGCNVMLNGFDADGDTAAIVASLESQGIRARYSAADLRDPAAIDRMAADAEHAFGAIDILVNNAVVRHVAPVESFTPAAWDESIAVNLSAAFHLTRLVVPSMKARRWGRIVNVSSIYGLRGAANRIGYVTTKTALLGLTRAVALETVTNGITCNAICPGTTETPIHEQAIGALIASKGLSREEAERQFFGGKQPTGRFISAEGVAALVLFLCGENAKDITGAALPVDGAWSAGG